MARTPLQPSLSRSSPATAKLRVSRSSSCAITALGAPPLVACLELAKQFGGSDARCTLIGDGKANVVYAAQYNTALVRYIDFMDSYIGGEELCHPAARFCRDPVFEHAAVHGGNPLLCRCGGAICIQFNGSEVGTGVFGNLKQQRQSRNGVPEEIWRYDAFTPPGQYVGIEGKLPHTGNKVVLDFLDDCQCNDYLLKSPEPR